MTSFNIPSDLLYRAQERIRDACEEAGLDNCESTANIILQDFLSRNAHFPATNETTLLISQLKKLNVSESQLEELCEKILKIEEVIFSTNNLPQIEESPWPLAFYCDLNHYDKNGGVLRFVKESILCELPFVTTQHLFAGSNFQLEEPPEGLNTSELIHINECYDIYESGSLYVFIPKTQIGNMNAEDKLRSLDFNPAILKKVTVGAALVVKQQPTLQEFKHLFLTPAKHGKILCLTGHGRVNQPGGLNSEQYQEFLGWLAKQHCLGLVVNSCYSGGSSSALHYPDLKENSSSFPLIPNQGINFPVIINSITDLPTSKSDESRKEEGSFLVKLPALFKSPGGRTVHNLRKLTQTELKNIHEQDTHNRIQVYYPPSHGSPGGFQVLEEHKDLYALTYNNYQAAHGQIDTLLKNKVNPTQGENKSIIPKKPILIANRSYITISPSLIEHPVEIQGNRTPTLFSQTPGKALHLLTDVSLPGINLTEFFSRNFDYYKNQRFGVHKALFIAKLSGEDTQLRQVFVNLKDGKCGYRDGDKYYICGVSGPGTPTLVSPFVYMLEWKKTVNLTIPAANSIRASTGGQQSKEELLGALNGVEFWEDQLDAYKQFQELTNIKNIREMNSQEASTLIKNLNFTSSELVNFICYILPHNEKLACALFELANINPNSKDTDEVPLLIHAVNGNHLEFTRLLIEKGADLNIANPSDSNTPLSLALNNQNEVLAELLLAQEGVDINARNKRGLPSYAYALGNDRLWRLFTSKKTSLNLGTTPNVTPLGLLVEDKSCEAVYNLLKAGANPNMPSANKLPLEIAIFNRDVETIDLLLEHGADPDLRISNESPIVLALKRSPVSVFEKLLKARRKYVDADENRRILQDIFSAALNTGDETKINLLLKHYPQYDSSQVDSNSWFISEDVLKKLVLFGHDSLLKELQSRKLIDLPGLLIPICEWAGNLPERRTFCLEVARKVILCGVDLNMLLSKIAKSPSLINRETFSLIFKEIQKNGGNLDAPAENGYATVFSAVAEHGSDELVAFCLEKRARIYPDNPNNLLTPLHAVLKAYSVNENRVRMLVVAGGGIDLSVPAQLSCFLEIIRKANVETMKFCLDQVTSVIDKTILKETVKAAMLSPELEKIDELIARGHIIPFEEWDLQEISQLLIDAYKTKPANLEKLLTLKLPEEALRNALPELLRQIIINDDLTTLELIENQTVQIDVDAFISNFDISKIVWRHSQTLMKFLERAKTESLRLFINRAIPAVLESGNITFFEYSLQHGLDPNFITEAHTGKTIIFTLIETDYSDDRLKILLRFKPNLSIRFDGMTPLEFTKKNKPRRVEMVEKAIDSV